MTNVPKGGRGYRAPYETTHRRIPVEIKPEVEILIARYRDAVMNGEEYKPTVREIDNQVETFPSREEFIELVKSILKGKKSARVSLAKVVSALYDVDCKPADL